ncbi:MAG: choline dehydrogenase, partial [Rhodospirillaceae bacterium]|nr:choline dehydrogenase [Rhodospirillaceae bacterium]
LLLEAGGKDDNFWIPVPAGFSKLLNNKNFNWCFETEPEDNVNGRRIPIPRGKTLGGSSSINGMLYVRGQPLDYDTWSQLGNRGWSYDSVLPYFKKSENYKEGGDPEIRGAGGPLEVEDARTILPLTHRFVEAAQEAGFKLNPDYNGREQEGVSYSQMTRRGRLRGSTARTYLATAKNRPNLTIETEAVATKLLFEGKKCVGVAYRQRGQDREIRVYREVLLSGGSINSPHLLQVSGVGPGEHLKSIGVEVQHDLPGVGGNLSDHYVVRISHRVQNALTINEMARVPRVIPEIIRWVVKGDGALTFGATTVMVFSRSREGLESPDLQFLFAPVSFDPERKNELEREPGMAIAICPGRPDSRGTIMSTGPDPLTPPAIRPNYLSAQSDLEVMLSGVKQARSIFAAPAIAKFSTGETRPGVPLETVDDMRTYAQANGTTIYHPVGTCKMGEDPQAVVDSRLRVHGLTGLRVIDASVMPVVTTGNTNAPTIMIAEKGAAMILEDNAG